MDPKRREDRSTLTEAIGRSAAVLSAIEIGLGSLLHTFRVPLTGTFLSLNQGFFLARMSLQERAHRNARFLGAQISSIASILKSLSPSGKKLTPMLAIATQGLLFSLGTVIFGVNALGLSVGMILLSLWSFVQSIFVYWIFYGSTLIEGGGFLLSKLQAEFPFAFTSGLWMLAGLVTVKLILALALLVLAYRLPSKKFEQYQQQLIRLRRKSNCLADSSRASTGLSQAVRLALRDLFHPLFCLSLVLALIYFVLIESPHSRIVWGLLRPVSIGFLMFLAIRLIPLENLSAWLDRRGWHQTAAALERAIQTVRS